jgi:hypothetical protein
MIVPSFLRSAWEHTVDAQRPFAPFPRRAWERGSMVRKKGIFSNSRDLHPVSICFFFNQSGDMFNKLFCL